MATSGDDLRDSPKAQVTMGGLGEMTKDFKTCKGTDVSEALLRPIL